MRFVIAVGRSGACLPKLHFSLRTAILPVACPPRLVSRSADPAGPDYADRAVGVARLRDRAAGPSLGMPGRRRGVVRLRVLAEAVEQFLARPVLAERHAGLGRVVRLLQRLGVVPLLRRLPLLLVSSMRFTVAASSQPELP